MEVSKERTVIAGRYELESLIGEGGMGSIWRAQDLTLARPVALKLLFGRDARDQSTMVKRFLREARIAASVQHRNVIHIVDFGTTSPGQPFMVMELLRGETLNERLDASPPLDVASFINIVSMTLRGLGAVHEAGIVHRDLKPDNIFLTRQDSGVFPKILDFGISRSVGPASGRRSALTTKEGLIVGTPEYMSPEQARGIRGIDHRTDIYSVGVILFEGLTGQLPFGSENVGDLIIQIVTGTAERVDKLNPSVPSALADVVERAMSHSPDDRYQTAQEMQEALLEAAGHGALYGVSRPLSERPARPRQIEVDGEKLAAQPEIIWGADDVPDVIPDASDPRARSGTAKRPSAPLTPPEAHVQAPVATDRPAASRARRIASPAMLATLGTLMLASVAVGAPYLWGEKQAIVKVLPDTHIAATLAPPTVKVQLVGLPDGAEVRLDGAVKSERPVRLPQDGHPRTLSISATGMQPWQKVVVPRQDTRIEVTLEPVPPAPKRKRSATRQRVRAQKPQPVQEAPPKRTKPKKAPPRALRTLDF